MAPADPTHPVSPRPSPAVAIAVSQLGGLLSPREAVGLAASGEGTGRPPRKAGVGALPCCHDRGEKPSRRARPTPCPVGLSCRDLWRGARGVEAPTLPPRPGDRESYQQYDRTFFSETQSVNTREIAISNSLTNAVAGRGSAASRRPLLHAPSCRLQKKNEAGSPRLQITTTAWTGSAASNRNHHRTRAGLVADRCSRRQGHRGDLDARARRPHRSPAATTPFRAVAPAPFQVAAVVVLGDSRAACSGRKRSNAG
ncbi:hypothetical protein OsJ_20555 [Oryza sativa Japonica Group]|uniref:Uncharacterized protein n=1 Tax=Oryza sativa subsp. japonica TaxID=39947 RepID=B9FS51_ORYSJ|nr:hypothetical protein OsJ_20555 [Oryza sativa Japonica Group]